MRDRSSLSRQWCTSEGIDIKICQRRERGWSWHNCLLSGLTRLIGFSQSNALPEYFPHPLVHKKILCLSGCIRMNPERPIFKTFQSLLDRRHAHSSQRSLSIAPEGSVDFSSNDFLSLSTSPALRAAYLQELEEVKHLPLGSGGSRLLDGNSTYMQDLEKDIASFHNAPAGLLFNSGFDANSGLFACVPQPGDLILYDEHIHASVHEGMRLSRASVCVSFAHNSVQDFQRKLREFVPKNISFAQGSKNVFVAVETVYSMDGDVAPIKLILDTLDECLPNDNGHLIVDEAHSTGVYGPSGRGIICQLGLEQRVFARLHTFGKALASGGGTS